MKTSTYTIGLDLSDRKVAVCVLDGSGKVVEETSLPNEVKTYVAISGTYPGATIALETGTHSPWVSRTLSTHSMKVLVANARKLRAIYKSDHKSDQNDARMLAKIARVDPELLSPIQHRSEAAQKDLIKLKVRQSLVQARVKHINSARTLLKSIGVRLPSQISSEAFPRKAREHLEPEHLELIEMLIDAVEELNERIKILEQQLQQMAASKYPVTERLRQIPGVGPMTALCFVLSIENHQRFKRARDIGPFLGLTPKKDQSGESDKQLRITKAGNTQLRCLLVNCAHYILGRWGPDCDLREAGLRICARGGSISKKRAVIATARKLAVTLLAIWKSGQDYRPLRISC
ncbi:MAG: IS110 family transposase [Puniceicoccaceae bacterium]